jgi:zinc transport system substrate-binding protein
MRSATLIALSVLVVAGCGAGSSADPAAPVLHVYTSLYPLAQAVEQIGQGKVTVTDVVPAGADPLTYVLVPAQVAELRQAGLVVEIGGGFQTSFEKAAAGSPHVLALQAALGASDPYVWLDPNVMQRAIAAIARAMEDTNPEAAGLYRSGEQDFSASVESTGIDYESTLSACPRTTIFTADDAFGAMARDYGLRDVVVGSSPDPSQSSVSGAAGEVEAAGATTVFGEPWLSETPIEAIAEAAHAKVRTLDTLAGPPEVGWPAQANYINLLESNLGTLSSALGCPDAATGSD